MKLIACVLLRATIYQNNGCKQHISQRKNEVVYAINIENYLININSFSDLLAWYRHGGFSFKFPYLEKDIQKKRVPVIIGFA